MEANYNTDQFNSIIQNRHSVFPNQFIKGKAVPDEIIWQILENANRAPNHKHTEPWRFTVFSGDGLQHFSKLQLEIYTQYAGDKFKEAKLKNLAEHPLMSSHVIAIGMKRNEEQKLPEVEEIIATACAIENMYLTFTAYGLGGYLSTGGITYFEEAKAYFDLGSHDRLVGFFYIGYIANPTNSTTKRQPIHEKVKWIMK